MSRRKLDDVGLPIGFTPPHVPRPPHKPWNRSSAFSVKAIGGFNATIMTVVPSTLDKFSQTEAFKALDETGRGEIVVLLVKGITEGVFTFAQALREELQQE